MNTESVPVIPAPPIVVGNKKRFNRKGILIASGLFVLGLLILGSLYTYFYYYLSPQQVLNRAVGKTLNVSGGGYLGGLNIEYKEPKTQSQAIKIPITFSLSTIGNFTRDAFGLQAEASYTVNAGAITLSEFDLRKIGPIFYLYIKNISAFHFPDTSKVINNWIAIEGDKLPVDFPITIPTLNSSQERNLIISFIQKPPILVTEKIEDESVSGSPAMHFKYKIDKENFIELMHLVSSDSLNHIITQVEFGEGEIWIRKSDEKVIRVMGNVTRKAEEINAPTIVITFDFSLKDEPSQIRIHAPETSTPVNDILDELSKGFRLPVKP